MKVWIALIGWDFEGTDIVGVYDSPEKAVAAAALARRRFPGEDEVHLHNVRGDYDCVAEHEVE